MTNTLSLCLAVLLFSSPALARDWFVKEGATGNGTKASPFSDPWEALDKCEAGDRIHVAQGKYYGRLESGVWKIPFRNVQLFGGYDGEFKSRDPWARPTELTFKPESKNKPGSNPRFIFGDEYAGFRLDGFVIDLDSQNRHGDDGSLDPAVREKTPLSLDQPGCVIANNVILNTSDIALAIRPGVTVENNLIINSVVSGIRVMTGTTLKGDTNTLPPVIRNNTIAFTWDPKEAGSGSMRGAAITLMDGPAVIEGNLLMNSDNQGITITGAKPAGVVLKNNTFFQNLFANVKVMSVVPVIIDDEAMDGLDEVGFKSVANNEVKNPKAKLPKEWMEKFSSRQAAQPGQVKMDEWNELRRTLGLSLIATGGKAYQGLAPAWKLKEALALLDLTEVKTGARRKSLTVDAFNESGAAAVQRSWESSELTQWADAPQTVAGKALSLVVGLGQPAGFTYAKVDGVTPDTHEATVLFDPKGQQRIIGFYKKGSVISRAIEGQATKRLSSFGTPPALFVVKGVAVTTGMVPKGGLVLDAFEERDAGQANSGGARPKGRDWFVRAGAKGGDGSREKPFKDPYQALEKVEAGDTVHVAEGEYSGKLRAAKFVIDMPYIALLGGYDADFKERDPWKRHTLLRFVRDAKNSYGQGYIVEGANDHRGAIVDGFVFDRRDYNQYFDNGDLQTDRSNHSEAVWLSSPGSTVRNCVFVNGADAALRISTATVVENNIFMNFVTGIITVQRGDDNTPALVRNNTILFSWNTKFGQGNVTTGWGVKFDTGARGVADNNIIAFIDNHAVEVFGTPGDVAITNNVFSHNLFSNYETSPDGKFIDDATMAQLPAAGLKAATGNVVQSVDLRFDPKWFEVYTNRTAMVPGKVAMDDWNQLRNLMGLNLVATGGKPGSGFAPMYDFKKAAELFPKKALKQGAQKVALSVKFEGIKREDPSFDWEETDWDAVTGDPAKFAGKRVRLKVSIRGEDNKYPVATVDRDAYGSWYFVKPQDTGRAKNFYVKHGTRFERVARQAKQPGPGEKPKDVYWLKGTVAGQGDVIVDVLELIEE